MFQLIIVLLASAKIVLFFMVKASLTAGFFFTLNKPAARSAGANATNRQNTHIQQNGRHFWNICVILMPFEI